ncbi:MAG: HEAT repeat domain-containing protein, partial [Phycisphaerae bacterium]|nr:HEAT repeat domain-containing protein [Phycisphaerae bacterium]
GRKKGNPVAKLIKAFDSPSADMRAGVCTAIGYQGERAEPAIDLLAKALSDKASTVRVAAAYAIMRTGKPGRRAIPDMLKAVVNQEKESPLEPVLQALSYSLGADGVSTAPLYFVGIFPSTPEGENPLDGIDRDILYPAVARMISARSARIRDCGAYVLRYFNRGDVKNMAREIYNLAKYRAPDFGMFSDRACGKGMDILAKFQISDGVKVCVDHIFEDRWGSYWREPHHFLTLQEYGKTASCELDRLNDAMSKRKDDNRKIVEETIKVIETDNRDLKPVTIKDLLDK